MENIPIQLDEKSVVSPWGTEKQSRLYFDELLPACFERTIKIDTLKDTEVDWIFTGPKAGVTVHIGTNEVSIRHRFYDSFGYNEVSGGKYGKHPEWVSPVQSFKCDGTLKAVTLRTDNKVGLTLLLNGKTVYQERWLPDLSRHQLRLTNFKGELRGSMVQPEPKSVTVKVDSSKTYQTILGFGGTATPTAYAMLSEKGKQRWWQIITEYNLLIQREYPMGNQLHPTMDNWDRLSDAVPHYYGDNFPNSEVSDFNYIKTIRKLGGQAWFEFWALPGWIGNDVNKYAQAMVRYCQVSKERTGYPPEIVGIQNEIKQTAEMWQKMTLTLRRALDKAGFQDVRIHMSNDGYLSGGVERAKAFRKKPEVWKAIDYSSSNIYDYQNFFTKPDDFDAIIAQWNSVAGDKPFISIEVCVNSADLQMDSYRVALGMGQLYHKELALANAVSICYCWTLLNVVQPTYGATRSLFVPDETHGFVPTASSSELRIFGAFSRRIHQGMTRVEAISDDPDLQVTAFEGKKNQETLVALNRSLRPIRLRVSWSGVKFTESEVVDPYNENTVLPISNDEITVNPGSIVTLTNVQLLHAS